MLAGESSGFLVDVSVRITLVGRPAAVAGVDPPVPRGPAGRPRQLPPLRGAPPPSPQPDAPGDDLAELVDARQRVDFRNGRHSGGRRARRPTMAAGRGISIAPPDDPLPGRGRPRARSASESPHHAHRTPCAARRAARRGGAAGARRDRMPAGPGRPRREAARQRPLVRRESLIARPPRADAQGGRSPASRGPETRASWPYRRGIRAPPRPHPPRGSSTYRSRTAANCRSVSARRAAAQSEAPDSMAIVIACGSPSAVVAPGRAAADRGAGGGVPPGRGSGSTAARS